MDGGLYTSLKGIVNLDGSVGLVSGKDHLPRREDHRIHRPVLRLSPDREYIQLLTHRALPIVLQ